MEINNTYRSDEINQIMAAMSKAQGTYKPLVANQKGPNGMFANLEATLTAVRESLASNGLGFYQYIELLDDGGGAAFLKTILGHDSGQYVSSCARVIAGKNERQTGNVYEIHRRRHAQMVLGIAPSPNDPIAFDDDGSLIADQVLIKELRTPDAPKPEIDRSDVVNTNQYEELLIELTGYEKIAKDIMQSYGIQTLADLPAEEYHKTKARILKLKRTHEEYIRSR